MWGIWSFGQTTYDRKQDRRIDTLSFAMAKLLSISQMQDEKIKALQDSLAAFKNGMVKSNQIVGIHPIAVRDSTATIKVIYFIK